MKELTNIFSQVGKVKPAYLGFALYLGLRFFYVHDAAPAIGAAGLSSEHLLWYLGVLLISKFIVFSICAFAAYRKPHLSNNGFATAAAILLALGLTISIILLQSDVFHFGAYETVLLLLSSSILLGIGDALMVLLWGRFLSTFSARATYLFLLVSYIVALVIFVIMVSLPPLVLILLTVGACISLPFLLYKSLSHRVLWKERKTDRKTLSGALSVIWRPLLLMSLFAFISCFTVFASGHQAVDILHAHVTSTLVTLAVILLALAITLLFPARAGFDLNYRLALPLAAGGLFLLAFFWNSAGGLANALVAMGWFLTDLALWCITANTAARTRVPAFLLFGIGQAVSCLISFAGIVAGYFFAHAIGYEIVALLTVAVIGIYLIATALVFLLKDRRVIPSELIEKEPDTTNASLSEEQQPTYIVEDRVQARVREISDQAELTTREAEVLGFLAQGRNTQYMAETLFLSENTVRSHVKNIYRKLDVHSKQDIIDIINRNDAPTLSS